MYLRFVPFPALPVEIKSHEHWEVQGARALWAEQRSGVYSCKVPFSPAEEALSVMEQSSHVNSPESIGAKRL